MNSVSALISRRWRSMRVAWSSSIFRGVGYSLVASLSFISSQIPWKNVSDSAYSFHLWSAVTVWKSMMHSVTPFPPCFKENSICVASLSGKIGSKTQQSSWVNSIIEKQRLLSRCLSAVPPTLSCLTRQERDDSEGNAEGWSWKWISHYVMNGQHWSGSPLKVSGRCNMGSWTGGTW